MDQLQNSDGTPTKRGIRLQIVEAEESCDAEVVVAKEFLKQELKTIRSNCKAAVARLKKQLASASEETQSAG